MKTRESILAFLLIASVVLHQVTSQNLEASSSQLDDRNNDEARTEATINEQQGKKYLNA